VGFEFGVEIGSVGITLAAFAEWIHGWAPLLPRAEGKAGTACRAPTRAIDCECVLV
jgi:hypothetical protein